MRKSTWTFLKPEDDLRGKQNHGDERKRFFLLHPFHKCHGYMKCFEICRLIPAFVGLLQHILYVPEFTIIIYLSM